MNNTEGKKLSLITKIGYGAGTLGESVAVTLFYLYFIYFLTDFAGINAAIAGTISLIAVLWDAVTDPLIGYLSDNSKNTKGRRRPFIAKFAIPLGIMMFVMFLNPTFLSGPIKVGYYLVINILFWLFFTATDIPYVSLGAEITEDYNERTTIRSYATMFYYFGFIVAGSGSLIVVDMVGKATQSPDKGWAANALFIALICTLSFFVSWFATKGKEPDNKENQDHSTGNLNPIKSYIEKLKIKPYRYLLIFSVIYMIGVLLPTSGMMYFLLSFMGMTFEEAAGIFLAYGVMVIIIAPVVAYLGNKFDKKTVLLVCVIFIGSGMMLFKVWDVTRTTMYLYAFLIALGNGAYYVLAYSMVYDVCEVDELNTGTRNEGAIVALFSFSIKLGTALSMWILGLLLEFYNYIPNAETQTPQAIQGIESINTSIAGIFVFLSLITLLIYPLSRKKYDAVMEQLEAKRAGREFSTDVIKELV